MKCNILIGAECHCIGCLLDSFLRVWSWIFSFAREFGLIMHKIQPHNDTPMCGKPKQPLNRMWVSWFWKCSLTPTIASGVEFVINCGVKWGVFRGELREASGKPQNFRNISTCHSRYGARPDHRVTRHTVNFQTSAMMTARLQLTAFDKPAAARLFGRPTVSGVDLSTIS